MVSILSPNSEESDGLDHERSRMAEAATDQYSTKQESDGLGHERSRMAEAAAAGAMDLFVVFGDFVVHLPSAPPCLCARSSSSSIQQRQPGTLTRSATEERCVLCDLLWLTASNR